MAPRPPAFWPEGNPLPRPVVLSIAAAVSLGALELVSAFLNARVDVAIQIFVLLFAATLTNYAVVVLWPTEIRASWRRGDYAKVALGLSPEVGAWGVIYGVLSIAALWIFGALLVPILGSPSYAVTADRAFVVLLVAPFIEEALLAGLWSLGYNAAGWWPSTIATSAAFSFLHIAAYGGAGTFAFVYFFAWRLIACGANWATTRHGLPPSTVPSTTAHIGLNSSAYYGSCVAGTQSAAAVGGAC